MKSVLPYSCLAFAALYSFASHAQSTQSNNEKTPTIEDELKADYPILLPKKFFSLTVENDTFASNNDENYTNGIRLGYFNLNADIPPFLQKTIKTIPGLSLNDSASIYYSIGQNMYTPRDLSRTDLITNDRPYAAFLYGSAGFTSLENNHIDEAEISVGIVGPAALGKQAQKLVHKHINASDPKGWEHQLNNEPGIIITRQRRWPSRYQATYGPMHFGLTPHISASLGNIYTHGAAGLTLQMAPKDMRWQSAPLRVKPAIPGNGLFLTPNNKISWSTFAAIETRAVARNIFLDGNTFESSHSVDKKNIVYDANIGISGIYKKARISYTVNWRSKEFNNQENSSIFGALSIAYKY